MSQLKLELCNFADKYVRGKKTRANYMAMASRFADHLQKDLNIQVTSIGQIKTRHIQAYVRHRVEERIGVRTITNEMAFLRNILRAAGRAKLADSDLLSNKSLGLAGASRKGTKEPIPVDLYENAMATAVERDPGFAACLSLCRHIGLRAEESVQSCKSLYTWVRAIERDEAQIYVVFGTKTGRPRHVTVIDRAKVLAAIKTAISVAEIRRGKLIDKSDLKSAMDRFHNEARAVGLTKKYAPHSLRYAFAEDALQHYLEKGLNQAEALAAVSMDLGHGDGRARYVKQTYIKK